jgi:hypothetical protein
MNIIDRLIVVTEYDPSILLRLAEYKQSFENGKLVPPTYKTLVDKKLWPLTTSNGIDPDSSKVFICYCVFSICSLRFLFSSLGFQIMFLQLAQFEKHRILKEDVLTELEPFFLLGLDFLDVRKASLDLLLEMGTKYTSFAVEEIKFAFINLFNQHIRLHLMFNAFKQLKPLIASYCAVSFFLKSPQHPQQTEFDRFLNCFFLLTCVSYP